MQFRKIIMPIDVYNVFDSSLFLSKDSKKNQDFILNNKSKVAFIIKYSSSSKIMDYLENNLENIDIIMEYVKNVILLKQFNKIKKGDSYVIKRKSKFIK